MLVQLTIKLQPMSFMIAPERRRLQAPARPTCLCARSLHQWLRAGPSVLLRRFVRGVPGRYARHLTPSPSERTCPRGSLNRLGVPERLVRAVSPLARLFTAPSRQTIMVVFELLAVPIEDSLRRSHFRLANQRFKHISAAAPRRQNRTARQRERDASGPRHDGCNRAFRSGMHHGSIRAAQTVTAESLPRFTTLDAGGFEVQLKSLVSKAGSIAVCNDEEQSYTVSYRCPKGLYSVHFHT